MPARVDVSSLSKNRNRSNFIFSKVCHFCYLIFSPSNLTQPFEAIRVKCDARLLFELRICELVISGSRRDRLNSAQINPDDLTLWAFFIAAPAWSWLSQAAGFSKRLMARPSLIESFALDRIPARVWKVV